MAQTREVLLKSVTTVDLLSLPLLFIIFFIVPKQTTFLNEVEIVAHALVEVFVPPTAKSILLRVDISLSTI
jgi:hypothetical protein